MHGAQNTSLNACTLALSVKDAYALVHVRICNGAEASLPWNYCELILSLVRAPCRRSLPTAQLLSRLNPSPDAVRSRNPSKSTLAHDTVAAAVSHKRHLIICVGAGLIQFYKSHSRLATELTHAQKSVFTIFARVLINKNMIFHKFTRIANWIHNSDEFMSIPLVAARHPQLVSGPTPQKWDPRHLPLPRATARPQELAGRFRTGYSCNPPYCGMPSWNFSRSLFHPPHPQTWRASDGQGS